MDKRGFLWYDSPRKVMKMELRFQELAAGDTAGIERMSALASGIVKEYYDPLLGAEQNDYMIEMFQSARSIAGQLDEGKRYFFVRLADEDIGFFCFYPHDCIFRPDKAACTRK